MAKRKKPEKPDIDDTQDIVDAVVVEEDDAPQSAPETAADNTPKDPDDEISRDEAVTLDAPEDDSVAAANADDTVEGDGTEPGEDVAPDDHDDTIAPDAEAEPLEGADPPTDEPPADDAGASSVEAQPDADIPAADARPEPAAPPQQQVIVKRGGFFPLLLGGVAAAAIGFGAARYVLPDGWPWPGTSDDTLATQLAQQADQLQGLSQRVEGIDLSALESQIAGTSDTVATLSARVNEAVGRLDTLEQEMAALAARPAGTGGDDGAMSSELQALRDSLAAQRDQIDGLLAEARAREEAAEATAQEALARAALSRVQTALDTGSDFSAALDDLRAAGVDVPGALADQAEGVPTMAQLGAAFPDAAREALGAARRASGEDGGLGGFLRTQLGVRSLEPQDGESADAVLSRAEAALRDGRLTDALAEIEALPEAGRAALDDWRSRAQARQDAVSAASDLAQSLTGN